jgi:hypothetical protein
VARRRLIYGAVLALAGLTASAWGQTPPPPANPGGAGDIELVERVLACRREYHLSLERLRAYYLSAGDLERARYAEDELMQFHRIAKNPFRLELDVPPADLKAAVNVPEANDLYRRAMGYKDKGWGTDYIDNQRRAELLLQQIISNYPQCHMIDDAAYQLGDLYESRAFHQYRRAALYFERCFQWNLNTETDARLRAARLYDRYLQERTHAIELYRDVITHEKDPKRIAEAEKRLSELSAKKY